MDGFILVSGRKLYFLPSENKNKCQSVIDEMIIQIGKHNNICKDVVRHCLNDQAARQDFCDRMSKGTYTLVTTENGYRYHHFTEKYSITNIPLDDDADVILLY